MNKKQKYRNVLEKRLPWQPLCVIIFLMRTDVSPKQTEWILYTGKIASVQEATESVGISRSSFYKYKDDIFPFHETTKGKTITMVIQMDDEPGLLSGVLKTIADFHANILTIHQSIPVNGIATLTLSIDILPQTGDVAEMVTKIESVGGIQYVKILARE